MHEQLPIPADITIEPRRVGGVAMNGGVERVDREPVVNLVPVEETPGLTLVDHRKPSRNGPPDLLAGGLSEEMRAWLSEQRQKEIDWRRRVAASQYDRRLW